MSSRHIPMKKRSAASAGGPFATRIPCNPETSVGLLAALVEPASAHLRVVEPFRHSARSITLALMGKATERSCNGCTCCNTPNCKMTTSPFCVNDYYSLSCKLCDRRMDDRIIYMYMSMRFCTEECRNEYFLAYRRYKMRMAMEAAEGRRTTRSEATKAPAAVADGKAANGYRRIFFTCAEVESFP